MQTAEKQIEVAIAVHVGKRGPAVAIVPLTVRTCIGHTGRFCIVFEQKTIALLDELVQVEAIGSTAAVRPARVAIRDEQIDVAIVVEVDELDRVAEVTAVLLAQVLMLAIVVLGGMGSQIGVAIAAAVMLGGFEFFREFAQFRMLVFGLAMVTIMIWRPRGLVATRTPSIFLNREEAINAELVRRARSKTWSWRRAQHD